MSAASASVAARGVAPVVLVVDDNAVQRLCARRAIERCGMRVEEAVDGAGALHAFARTRHDMVLLDLMMPGIDGFEVCTRLREIAPSATTPVLIMTALHDTISIERAYECGATDFVTKPVNWPILGHRVRYMLRAAQVSEALVEEISARRDAEQALLRSNEEQRQINQQLRETRNQLLQSEKMASIGQLAAGVAHEINNPIGYVKSNLGALGGYLKQVFDVVAAYERADASICDPAVMEAVLAAKESADLAYLTEDVFALMRESEEGISRVSKIVEDLKDFSHGGGDDEWRHADLHEGIDSTINIVNNEIKYKAQLVREYGALPQVECLPSQLNQVFMNILVNAAHSIDGHGTITVRTCVGVGEGEEVRVEITDTGSGIDPGHIDRIFDPFFTTKPVGKGTGLGLALSYGIVRKHRGRIEVESRQGHGTTFRVCIPVRRQAAAKGIT
ncbi:MAG: histidine kinase [Betaproteobacteria bacterium]|nr:histidine kinase [Betaproteobacteria bacterium]